VQSVFKNHSSTSWFISSRFWLSLIILLAIFLRVGVAFYLGDQIVDAPGTADQLSYDMLSQRVLAGKGFTVATSWWPATRAEAPTAHWSYLYTLYLVVVYGLFGYHPLLARLIQAILSGILMPWLIYRLGSRYFDTRVGLVSAGLVALYAYFIYYSAALMTEAFYITALLWVLDLSGELGQVGPRQNSSEDTLAKDKHQNLKLTIGLGAALAITVLLRQLFLIFIPILFGWLLWRSYRYQTRPVKPMLGILLGAVLILVLSIVPWTLRNYWAFNKFVLLNTNAGFVFYWGNHPIHGYDFISILPEGGPSYQELLPPELARLNEADLDQALLKRGLDFIVADPGRYVILSLSRIKDYFEFWPSADSGLMSNLLRLSSFGLLWPFMLFGFVVNLRRVWSSEILILYLFVITYTVIHLLSWTLIRYRLPVDAILVPFAATILLTLYARLVQSFTAFQTKPRHFHF